MQLIEDASAQKLRGAYYTPPAIASFILHWGINGSTDADILEPSCGDGVFFEQMATEHMLFHHATGVEYEAVEADTIRKTKSPKTQNEKSKKNSTLFFSVPSSFFFTQRQRVLRAACS